MNSHWMGRTAGIWQFRYDSWFVLLALAGNEGGHLYYLPRSNNLGTLDEYVVAWQLISQIE